MPHEPRKNLLIGQTDAMDVVIVDGLRNYRTEEHIQHKITPDARGSVFIDLLRAWGMVAAKRGKDNPSGRPSLELLSVGETVERAAQMTEQAFSVMRQYGWLADIKRPAPEDPEKDPDATE